MNVLIITGGSIDVSFAKQYMESRKWDFIICADSGMEFCRSEGILPDILLGDFDSAKSGTVEYFKHLCPERMLTFPAQKDETDTELAILKALEAGAKDITILGGTGSRLDHVLGNIHLLKMALDAGVNCMLVDAHNRIRMIRGRLELQRAQQFGRFVSLIPFTPQVSGLTLRGFAYEVENFVLAGGKARGVSNEIIAKKAVIELKEGILLVIESDD